MKNQNFCINLKQTENALVFELKGSLTHNTASYFWGKLKEELEKPVSHRRIEINAEGLLETDATGLTAIYSLQKNCHKKGVHCTLVALPQQFQILWQLLNEENQKKPKDPSRTKLGKIEQLGKKLVDRSILTKTNITYFGEIVASLFQILKNPKKLRLRKVFFFMEKIGPDSLPLVILIGTLFGIILSFLSAVQLKKFGAEIYVANMVIISLFRELGPLLTAIIITGRTASAFAAEISTMKTNEEIDALTTMGLDPIPYLIIPRLVAVTLIAPLLAFLLSLFGTIGCLFVMLSQGYARSIIIKQMLQTINVSDLTTGTIKATVFGFVVVCIGCIQGLNSGRNAMAVGISTTTTVVQSIVMVTILDGIFASIYYSLGA